MKIYPYFRLLRPHAWLKNFFIFAPAFFAGKLFDLGTFDVLLATFVLFSLVASAVYILNDLVDIEQDRKHLFKRLRPLASGAVPPEHAKGMLAVIAIGSIAFGYVFVPSAMPWAILYMGLNILYSFWLKKIPVIDIMCIAVFFLIRIIAGGVVANIVISLWLALCTVFISLFLIIGKRLAEFEHKEKRVVLKAYSAEFLKMLLVVSATLSIISYALYTLLALNSLIAVSSTIFVMFGIFRYLFLVYTTDRVEYPERVVIEDKAVFVSTLAWGIMMFYLFY